MTPISPRTIKEDNPGGIFDGQDPLLRRRVKLNRFPLLDDDGQEIPIYNSAGDRIRRRAVIINDQMAPCGVLVDLTNIHALFDPYGSFDHGNSSTTSSDLAERHVPHVDAYPLAFLRTVGNIQADGIPACFYPLLTTINRSVRKGNRIDRPTSDDDHGSGEEEEEDMSVDSDEADGNDYGRVSSLQVVKPVSAQFYNYITHRVATRASRHDAQQGTVTAAISGGFASSQKHKMTASNKQSHCDLGLPSDRFHTRISLDDSPTSCRVEFVYSVDVRALKNPSGTHVTFPSFPELIAFLNFYRTGLYSTTSSFLSPDHGSQKTFVARSRTI